MDSYTSNDLNELSMTGIGSLLGATEEDINALEVRVSSNESNITTLQADLATEVNNRTNADTVLQDNIEAEEEARIDGDALKVNKSGDTMTGSLKILGGNIGLNVESSTGGNTHIGGQYDKTYLSSQFGTIIRSFPGYSEIAKILTTGIELKRATTITGNLTVSNPNEIYYKGETLDTRFDAEEQARIDGDALKVNKSGDTMTGDLNIVGANIKIFNDTTDVCKITMEEHTSQSNLIMEYNGVGMGSANFFALYSGYPSWVGLGDGFNYVPSNGRVGIGLSNPSEKLEVNGNAIIGGNLTISKPTENAQINILCNGASGTSLPDLYSQVYLGESLTFGAYYRYAESSNIITIGANNDGEIPMISWDRDGTDFTIHKNTEITGDLTVSVSNEIYYKGETLDARFHSLDTDYYTEAESNALFVKIAGDTMTGNLTVDGLDLILGDGFVNDATYRDSGRGIQRFTSPFPNLTSILDDEIQTTGRTKVIVGMNEGYVNSNSLNHSRMEFRTSDGEVNLWGSRLRLNDNAELTYKNQTLDTRFVRVSGDATITGNLVANNAFIGERINGDNYAIFSHQSLKGNVDEYAIRQGTEGNTIINSKGGQPLHFRIANDNKMVIASDGNITMTNNLVANDAFIGERSDNAGFAIFSHQALKANSNDFAVLQRDTGGTIINSKEGQDLDFRIGGTTYKMKIASDGNITMAEGLTVADDVQANEFIITNSTSTSTTRLGYQTLGGNEGVFIGYRAGALNTGTNNTAVGYESMYSSSVATYSTCLGRKAGYHNRGAYNHFIGMNAGYGFSSNKITGGYNIGFGTHSLSFLTTGANNVCVGNFSGYYTTSGIQNTAIGHNAMRGYGAGNLTTGNYNVAVGYASLYYLSSGNYNTAVGYDSMNGVNNTATLITGSQNTAVGRRSLFRLTEGANNVCVGFQSMGDETGGVSGDNNVCVGYRSGYKIKSGGNNLCLGHGSGENNTGSNNVFVGAYSGSNTSNVNHRLGIGYDAEPTQEKEILITTGSSNKNQFQMLTDGMSWIFGGTTKMLMEIVSSVATYNFYGNLKVWIGNINTTGFYQVDDNPLLNVSFCSYQSDANPPANTYKNLHFLHPYVGSGESHLNAGNAIRVAVFPRPFKLYAICLMLDEDTNIPTTTIKIKVFGNNRGTGATTDIEIVMPVKLTTTTTTIVKNLDTPIEIGYGCFSAEFKHSLSASNEGAVYFYGTQV